MPNIPKKFPPVLILSYPGTLTYMKDGKEELLEGVIEFLDELRSKGIRTVLVSSGAFKDQIDALGFTEPTDRFLHFREATSVIAKLRQEGSRHLVFVGDLLNSVSPAARMGIQTIVFDGSGHASKLTDRMELTKVDIQTIEAGHANHDVHVATGFSELEQKIRAALTTSGLDIYGTEGIQKPTTVTIPNFPTSKMATTFKSALLQALRERTDETDRAGVSITITNDSSNKSTIKAIFPKNIDSKHINAAIDRAIEMTPGIDLNQPVLTETVGTLSSDTPRRIMGWR